MKNSSAAALPLWQVQENATSYGPANEQAIINQALAILERRLKRGEEADAPIRSPDATRAYLRLKLAGYNHEVFAVLWLDTRHRVLAFEEMFRGTVDGASVHPREVVTSALRHRAVACIFAHNHPSGVPEPSEADERLTRRLKEALGMVDIRVLDHMVVGHDSIVSMAERRLL